MDGAIYQHDLHLYDSMYRMYSEIGDPSKLFGWLHHLCRCPGFCLCAGICVTSANLSQDVLCNKKYSKAPLNIYSWISICCAANVSCDDSVFTRGRQIFVLTWTDTDTLTVACPSKVPHVIFCEIYFSHRTVGLLNQLVGWICMHMAKNGLQFAHCAFLMIKGPYGNNVKKEGDKMVLLLSVSNWAERSVFFFQVCF